MTPSARVVETAAACDRLHEDSAGIVELQAVLRSDLPALLALRAAGNAGAAEIVALAEEAVWRMAQLAPSTVTCGACAKPIGDMDFSLAFVRACDRVDDGSPTLGLTICTTCAPTRAHVITHAIENLRSLWPGVRRIAISNQAGRA